MGCRGIKREDKGEEENKGKIINTLYPTPHAPHPTPHTPRPTPYTPRPTPYTPHPTP
ncbi:MAG: hypothetical protein F6J93_34705 [Oscillatoria sp. SIO1A7]|nr:hypothetical protein [Oscillatoria sp. SIO1A7]